MDFKTITSTQNALIKQIVLLKDKSRERKKSGLFVAEGIREIDLAKQGGFIIKHVLFDEGIFPETEVNGLKNLSNDVISVSKDVYKKIAYRESTEGIVAVIESKTQTLDDLKFKTDTPLILVAEAPEKPGNIGAILRTADAANIDAVIIANPKTDLFNPNIIRSSVGCVFTNQTATGKTEDIIAYLQAKNINIYSAILQESQPYHTQDYTKSSAIVLGTEATGLTQEWRDAAKQNISIPMQGAIDSMNVSVAGGILIFEAKRQRNFK